jgi:transposase-like protein
LEAELTDHLGYEPHEPKGRGTGNNRNGKGRKTVQSETGTIDIQVPRDRNGTFEPKLVKKRQRRLEGFDDKVLALYSHGLSTRGIQEQRDQCSDG